MMTFPTEWKVINFHGSKPPSRWWNYGEFYGEYGICNVDGGSKQSYVTQGSGNSIGNFMGLKQPEIIDGNHENLEVWCK